MKIFQNEYEYLVHLLVCALQDRQPQELPKSFSFQKVFSYGKAHEVANIAFLSIEKLQNKPCEGLYKEWKTYHALSIRRHANQMMARDAIVQALDKAAIRHMQVQGTLMKQLYPQPYWRMMSDIDFIIDAEALQAVEGVMQSIGYTTVNPNGVEVDAQGKNGIFVELHSDFFAPTSVCYGSITDPFSYGEPAQGYAYEASDTIFYLYNLLHIVKHFLQQGTGIRRIMDLYIMESKLSGSIDRAYIQTVLQESGYEAMAKKLLAVAQKWFAEAALEEDLSKEEALIFESNNHGTYQVSLKNEYNKASAEDQRFFKLKRYLALLFPKKEDIYNAYPRCKRWKLPTLLCWIYRWVSICVHSKKRKYATSLLSNISKTKIK